MTESEREDRDYADPFNVWAPDHKHREDDPYNNDLPRGFI